MIAFISVTSRSQLYRISIPEVGLSKRFQCPQTDLNKTEKEATKQGVWFTKRVFQSSGETQIVSWKKEYRYSLGPVVAKTRLPVVIRRDSRAFSERLRPRNMVFSDSYRGLNACELHYSACHLLCLFTALVQYAHASYVNENLQDPAVCGRPLWWTVTV